MKDDKNKIIFSRRHAKIKSQLEVWKLERDAYIGGSKYKQGGYLHKFPLESQDRYNARAKRSVYFNHVQPIADMLAGFLFASSPGRKAMGFEYLIEKASKKKSLDAFMQTAAVHSLLYPVGVLVDSPSFDPDVVKTQADRQALNLNPYCVMYRPENIRDFSTDGEGQLIWVLLDNTYENNENPFSTAERVKTYRLWTREYYQDFTEQDDKIIAGEEIAHPVGEVPFVFMNWRDIDEDNIAESIFEDIALLDQAIYNFISLLDEMITAGTFQVLFWPGDELPQDMIKSGVGALSVIPYNPADGGKPYYDGAKLSELAPFLSAIEMYLKEVFSKVGLDKDHDKISVQSGVAKGKEFEKAETILRMAAEQLENAEQRIFDFAGKWSDQSSEAVQITYNRAFQREDVDILLTRLYELLTMPFDSVKNLVQDEIIVKVLSYLDSDKLNALLKEIEAERKAEAAAPPPMTPDEMVNEIKTEIEKDGNDEQTENAEGASPENTEIDP